MEKKNPQIKKFTPSNWIVWISFVLLSIVALFSLAISIEALINFDLISLSFWTIILYFVGYIPSKLIYDYYLKRK